MSRAIVPFLILLAAIAAITPWPLRTPWLPQAFVGGPFVS
jgi:hypothetical protein